MRKERKPVSERGMRLQYRAAMRVLRAIPSGTPDENLTDRQRLAWRQHDEALEWFTTSREDETK